MLVGSGNKEKLKIISQKQEKEWKNKELLCNPNSKKLSIIMPAYNEEQNLAKSATEIINVLEELKTNYEFIIVNDGSKDKTKEVCEELTNKYNQIKVINHEKNRGYGEAQITGFKNASGDYISVIPSDNQFSAEDLKKYIKEIENCDLVLGYRKKRADSFKRNLYAKTYNLSLFFLFGLKVKDVDWVKFYKKDFIDSIEIESRSALIDTELVIKAKRNGLKINQIECNHLPRRFGTATGNNFKVLIRELKEFTKFWLKSFKKTK